MQDISTIVCIGAGNVATHLTCGLKQKGYKILQVISRSESSASDLAQKLSAEYSTDISSVFPHADLYILAVSDDSIADVAEGLPHHLKLVAHTSGSTSLNVLKNKFPHSGVIYPLQTFSKDKDISFQGIPFLIEGSDKETVKILKKVASKLSGDIREVDSQKRKILHIAAVFACNFTNHMCAVAEDLLNDKDLDFELLKPLIRETFGKIEHHSPSLMQTGPAVRNDRRIIEDHISSLNKHPEYQNLYTFVSRSIFNFYNKKDK